MRQYLPLTFIIAGLSMLFGGFFYDVIFAGIPYQDLTPEMSARYSFHEDVASAIRLSGVGVFLVGLVILIVRSQVRRL